MVFLKDHKKNLLATDGFEVSEGLCLEV